MSEVITWYLESESYTENVSIAQYKPATSAAGTAYGIVSLNKQLTLKLRAKMPEGKKPGDTGYALPVPAVPAGQTAKHLTCLLRGFQGLSVAKAAMTSQNDVDGAQSDAVGDFVLQGGRAMMEGYEDELLGVTSWLATYISEGTDVKRLYWVGAMTPQKFRRMSSSSVIPV